MLRGDDHSFIKLYVISDLDKPYIFVIFSQNKSHVDFPRSISWRAQVGVQSQLSLLRGRLSKGIEEDLVPLFQDFFQE